MPQGLWSGYTQRIELLKNFQDISYKREQEKRGDTQAKAKVGEK